METASERRRRNLLALCKQFGIDEVASRAGLSRAALDQIIKGVLLPAKRDGSRRTRSLGPVAARAIERAFGKPEGWLDSSAPASVAAFASRESLSADAVALAIGALVPSDG